MLDPVLRLAVSMHSGKGIYALLLGSGVSRSAAVPTGWEIMVDLIRKLAHLKGESCDPSPEAWYNALTGAEPDYSDILDQLSPSSADRAQLLRACFEPTEEEREQGRKMPSEAHRAIAALVAKGYIRVIVTTNFDRLMEHALSEAGVQPTIISTADAVHGALPLTHSPCTVVKIHGDYLDNRLRNTRPELSAYEKPLDDLLDRIFDEFGLLVCGWSAEWDVALRAAIERCATHRFGTYWAAHKGNVSGEAQKLIALRRATVVPISDADSFLQDLAEKIRALEDLEIADRLTAKVAVARMKRYLTSPQHRINLHDLVNAETERVRAAITSERFSAQGQYTDRETAFRRVRAYESELSVLLPVLACGGHWADDSQAPVLARALKRLADQQGTGGGLHIWLGLQKYPATLAMYAMGIAATGNDNYSVLKHLFGVMIRPDNYRPEESIIEPFSPQRVLQRDHQREILPGRDREHTALNNHIFEVLRDPLREYLPDDLAYDDAFDWFEYLAGLVHCDLTAAPEELERIKADPANGHIWGPTGRFLWNRRTSKNGVQIRTHFEPNGPYPENVTALLRAGLFRSDPDQPNYERFLMIKSGFDRHIGLVRQELRVW